MEEHNEISNFLRLHVVDAHVAPLAVAGRSVHSAQGWHTAMGVDPTGKLARPFDLASLSKPFLALLCARLVEKKELSWQTCLGAILPAVAGTPGGDATIEQHLSHRAGLRAHIEFFRPTWQGASLSRANVCQAAACATRPKGTCDALYSDLGYFLVGEALQQHFRMPLDRQIQELVTSPWNIRAGSARSWRASNSDFTRLVAPTEIQPPRGGLLQGVVHDDNSWMLSGCAASGHAGLFGTLGSVLELGRRLLEERDSAWLEPVLRRREGGSLRMGVDGVSGKSSAAGSSAGPRTFGHLGFTGTSIWCDPDSLRVTALLTNRVHPTRENPAIRAARPKMHEFLSHC